MIYCGIEITHSTARDEARKEITVYGLRIRKGNTVFEYPDLCTDRGRLERLCDILDGEIPTERLLSELFEDYIF